MSVFDVMVKASVPKVGMNLGELIVSVIVIMFVGVTLSGLFAGKLDYNTVYQDLIKFMGGILTGYVLGRSKR